MGHGVAFGMFVPKVGGDFRADRLEIGHGGGIRDVRAENGAGISG